MMLPFNNLMTNDIIAIEMSVDYVLGIALQ